MSGLQVDVALRLFQTYYRMPVSTYLLHNYYTGRPFTMSCCIHTARCVTEMFMSVRMYCCFDTSVVVKYVAKM